MFVLTQYKQGICVHALNHSRIVSGNQPSVTVAYIQIDEIGLPPLIFKLKFMFTKQIFWHKVLGEVFSYINFHIVNDFS